MVCSTNHLSNTFIHSLAVSPSHVAIDTSETPPPSDTVKSKLTQPKLTHPRTKFRTINPSDCMDIAIEGEGLASEEPTTIGAVFKEAVSKLPNHPALKFKEEGVYKEITYKQYYTFVLNAAKSLLKVSVVLVRNGDGMLMYLFVFICFVLFVCLFVSFNSVVLSSTME